MTLHEIQYAVSKIAENAGDDETAHVLEDNLYVEVLEHFANEAPEQWAALAREALKARDLDFARWCA